MYSPTTRLLTMLELLQSRKAMSGTEMARRLEVDVRTVRRYIVMLQDMGIPVEAERGPYGAYQLRRGFKMPPLMFTDSEAVALTLGLLAIRELGFPVGVAAVEGALAKTERVMPENLLQQVRGLQAITFNVAPPPVLPQSDFVITLSTAVQQQKQVRLRYQSWRGDDSERTFDPYGIVFNDGYWYTAGYCHLREDVRTFRLDRITALEPCDDAFERPANFDVLAYVINSVAVMPGTEQVEVLMRTSMERARQIVAPEMGELEETAEGILFRRSISQLGWIAHVLSSVEFPIFVRRPAELRDLMRQIATRALQSLEDEHEID